MWYLSPWVWLIYFNMVSLSCIHFGENGRISLHCIYIYHIFFINSPPAEYLGWFQILAIVNYVAINMVLRLSLWFIVFKSFGHKPSSQIVVSYDRSIYNFWRNLCTVCYSGDSSVLVFPFASPHPPHLLHTFDFSHSDKGEVQFHHDLDLHFPDG